MKSSSTKTFISAAVIILGFSAVFVLSNHLEQVRPAPPEGYADSDLALKGAKLKGFSLGLEGLLADWYWMQSLQYIGDKISTRVLWRFTNTARSFFRRSTPMKR
jgi:hypothetical protein